MKSRIQIRKIQEGVFKHVNQDGTVLIDSRIHYVATQNIFHIIGQKNTYTYTYSEIEVYDDTALGTKELFSNPSSLTIRLRELGYTSFQDDAITVSSSALPNGASTSTLQTAGNASLVSIDNKVLTDIQLRATPLPISPRPNTTGANGTTPYKLISLTTTNANVVKNSGGNLYSIVAIGLTSTVRFLKFYNKATAPIVGTDIPTMTIPIPANTQGAGISIPFSMGVNFPLGISIAITAGSADNNSAAILANDVLVNLTYA